MAGGKQSPRQKMINLMYLVFIAMMALNMSKEVLSAFGLMNEKLALSNVRTGERNAAFMTDLAAKVEEQPEKYKPEMEKAKQLNVLSTELESYLESVKGQLLAGMTDDQKTDYQTMDKNAILDEYFFNSGAVGPNGQAYIDKVNEYREGVVKLLTLKPGEKGTDFSENIKSVIADFNTNDVTTRELLL